MCSSSASFSFSLKKSSPSSPFSVGTWSCFNEVFTQSRLVFPFFLSFDLNQVNASHDVSPRRNSVMIDGKVGLNVSLEFMHGLQIAPERSRCVIPHYPNRVTQRCHAVQKSVAPHQVIHIHK